MGYVKSKKQEFNIIRTTLCKLSYTSPKRGGWVDINNTGYLFEFSLLKHLSH